MLRKIVAFAAALIAVQASPVSAQRTEPTTYPFYCVYYGDDLWLRHGDNLFQPSSITRVPGDYFVEATDAQTGEIYAAFVPRANWQSTAEEWIAQCRLEANYLDVAQTVTTEIDGVYRPPGASWMCERAHRGLDSESLSIEDGMYHRGEGSCELTAPVRRGSGTAYTGLCQSEGSEFSRTEFVITPLHNGLSIQRGSETFFVERCPSPEAVNTLPGLPTNERWMSGWGQGVTESWTRDEAGNSVYFSCRDGGYEGGLSIMLRGEPISRGRVGFEIDGQLFEMTTQPRGGGIDTECIGCGQTYMALWEAVAAGNLMIITAPDGRTAAFSLNGSRDALGDEVCLPDDGS